MQLRAALAVGDEVVGALLFVRCRPRPGTFVAQGLGLLEGELW
jgi:hypothetical protein